MSFLGLLADQRRAMVCLCVFFTESTMRQAWVTLGDAGDDDGVKELQFGFERLPD